MSKQCYWSSGARRKDWSVNSLRCWRCLVINTPDETPSKAHPLFTGSLLLLALSLSLHQAPQCFLLLAPDAWLHWLHLVLVWSYFFSPSAYYRSVAFFNPLLDWFFSLPALYSNISENQFISFFAPSISLSTHCPFSPPLDCDNSGYKRKSTSSYH